MHKLDGALVLICEVGGGGGGGHKCSVFLTGPPSNLLGIKLDRGCSWSTWRGEWDRPEPTSPSVIQKDCCLESQLI